MSKYRTCAFFVDNVRCLWCPVSGHINRSSTLSEVFVGKTIDYRDAAYWKDIVKAKQAFLAGDQAAAEGRVRPLVLESWKRCLPFLGTKLAKKRTCLEQSALTHVMQQNRELLACAIPVIEYLNTILGSSSTVVLLTSGDGVLLHKHVGTKSRAAAALLSLGMLMGEEYEGTTSTALCLREQSVVELFGAEHLIREEEDLCCISAPIFGGKRRMLGVLTIALPLELYHLHTSGMVLMAAKDISDQHHLHDLLSDQEAILEQVDTGIVVLDKNGGIKAANCTGRSMLHISPPPAPLGNINDVLGSAESLLMMIQSRKNIRDRECFFNLTDGGSLQCMLSAAPIPNDKGMVLFLHEASKAQRLAAHSVGAKAIYTFSSIIGESPSLQKAIELSKVASHSNITTLILGESGTGKELFAHAIHNASARKNAPFVVVNCGALPRDLIQSELFGYDPGAFTGAQKQGKPGKFELAEGGTIFLDEIGDMPLEAQINLLRVIQNKEVSRIGGQVLPADRRPHHRRDQQAPAAERARRLVPGGSVLPPERADHRCPAPAGKTAGRHAAGGIFPPGRRTGHPQAMPGVLGRSRRDLQPLSLAGERAGTGEHRGAFPQHRPRGYHRAGRPAAFPSGAGRRGPGRQEQVAGRARSRQCPGRGPSRQGHGPGRDPAIP